MDKKLWVGVGIIAIIYLIYKSNSTKTSFIGSDIDVQEGFMPDTIGKVVVPVNDYNFKSNEQ
jgi:hypothetical protein